MKYNNRNHLIIPRYVRKVLSIENNSKYKLFISITTIINILLLLLAIYLSIQNYQSSSDFQVDIIQNINSIRAQSDSLIISLNSIPTTIKSFGKSIEKYKEALDETIQITEKQLELLKETQKMWESELSKRPILKLVIDSLDRICDDSLFIKFVLHNTGNTSANITSINLFLPSNIMIQSPKWMFVRDDGSTRIFTCNVNSIIPFNDNNQIITVMHRVEFNLVLKVENKNNEFPSSIKYMILEEKYGTQQGELQLVP